MILFVSVKLSLSSERRNLNMSGYNLITTNHPSNLKGGDVCICYNECLALQNLGITALPERLVCKVSLSGKTSYVVVT